MSAIEHKEYFYVVLPGDEGSRSALSRAWNYALGEARPDQIFESPDVHFDTVLRCGEEDIGIISAGAKEKLRVAVFNEMSEQGAADFYRAFKTGIGSELPCRVGEEGGLNQSAAVNGRIYRYGILEQPLGNVLAEKSMPTEAMPGAALAS